MKASPVTSQVLLQLMEDVDTPTDIAKKLRIKPPSVMEQLGRLRRIGIVRPAEKTGKHQHYAINWDAFAIEAYYTTVIQHFSHPSATKRIRARAEGFVSRFPDFVKFLRVYFGVLVPSAVSRDYRSETCSSWLTILYANLEAVVDAPRIAGLVADDPSLSRFLDPLQEWVEASRGGVDSVNFPLLLDTMNILGFKIGEFP
jgi:DNA-binding transcriptional ArsR family regulator